MERCPTANKFIHSLFETALNFCAYISEWDLATATEVEQKNIRQLNTKAGQQRMSATNFL